MVPATPSNQLIAALEQIGPDDHLCSIYESQGEQFAVAVPFIRFGLDRGEKCVYIADDDNEDDFREALQAEGIDVERALASNTLVLTTKEQTYLNQGSFDADRMIAFWRGISASAVIEGFAGLRAAGETVWVVKNDRCVERWLDYECKVNQALNQNNCLALCQYDRRVFSPEIILNIIRRHPFVVCRGQVCRNLFYVPPKEFMAANEAERELERILAAISEREGVESALAEREEELKRTQSLLQQQRESEERFRLLIAEGQKLSHTGSWAWNVATGELFWSREHFRIFGLDTESTKPTFEMCFQMVHPEDRLLIRQKFEAAVSERRDFDEGYRIVRPDETIRSIRSIAHPVFDDSGNLTEYVGTVVDVTEQVEAKRELALAFEEINALKERLHHEKVALREEIDRTAMFDEIVGSSPAIKSVLSRVAKVAPADSTVLFTGETGTGKELIARAIHNRSNRSNGPFIAFSCAGVPASLIASELFGHEKGAFTGAQQRRLGRFELAEGGTIFLDEVGEFPAETQIALLRVLQEREFERVGGGQPVSANVRIIAATNRNLEDAIVAGTFRLDLFYRLNVFPIEMPPLRERKEDIPLLLDYFIKRYADKAGKQISGADKKTIELCEAYSWPGNIRELQNVVERSVIVCESEIFSVDPSWLSAAPLQPYGHMSNLAERLREQEQKIIEAMLGESKGRIAGRHGAAAKLGIPSSTLESKIKTLKINKNHFKPE